MQTSSDLMQLLNKIDHRGYPAYKDLKGAYQFPGYVLSIDHVQGDPFAAPSKVSLHVPAKTAGFPKNLYDLRHRRIALQDELTRQFWKRAERFTFQAKGSGKSGLLTVSRCGQEILERTACTIQENTGDLVLRIEVGFPANGRTINAGELRKILFEFLPECVKQSLQYKNMDKAGLQQLADLSDDQQFIREFLAKNHLCAFVGNGSILPRQSGVSTRPLKDGIPFVSPKELEITLTLPHKGKLAGMGILKGVTLIVGGGYHGKSTLLKALELGVYDHIPGDGREYVITDKTAIKLRAEEGRSILKTDISMFINNLPNGKDTHSFSTENASGSTSQAANVIEGMEAGTSLFLIDEDTSATNFMIRDELMQRVIHREQEPITPFIERARELYEKYGISSVIVAGSSGAYFHIADTIIQMDKYVPKLITALAKKEAESFPMISAPLSFAKEPDFRRCPKKNPSFQDGERIKTKTFGCEELQINKDTIDLRQVEQLVDPEQLNALAHCMIYAQKHLMNGRKTLQQIAEELEAFLDRASLEGLCERGSISSMARPRKQEIVACFNRFRNLQL